MVFLRQPLGILGVMTSALSLFLLWGLFFPPRAPSPACRWAGPTARRRCERQHRQYLTGAYLFSVPAKVNKSP